MIGVDKSMRGYHITFYERHRGLIDFQHVPVSPRGKAKYSNIRLTEIQSTEEVAHHHNDNVEKIEATYYTNDMISQIRSHTDATIVRTHNREGLDKIIVSAGEMV